MIKSKKLIFNGRPNTVNTKIKKRVNNGEKKSI